VTSEARTARSQRDVEQAQRDGRRMARHVQRTSTDREFDSLQLLSQRAFAIMARTDPKSEKHLAAEREYARLGIEIAKIRLDRIYGPKPKADA